MAGSSLANLADGKTRHKRPRRASTQNAASSSTTTLDPARVQPLSPNPPVALHDKIAPDAPLHNVNTVQGNISERNLKARRAQTSNTKANLHRVHPMSSSSSYIRKQNNHEVAYNGRNQKAGSSSTVSKRSKPIEIIVLSSSSPSPPPTISNSNTNQRHVPPLLLENSGRSTQDHAIQRAAKPGPNLRSSGQISKPQAPGSTHVQHAYDEDSDIEVICVDDMLKVPEENHSRSRRDTSVISISSSMSSSSDPLRCLFTPPPAPRPHRRRFLSHVAVPPLSASRKREDYKPLVDTATGRTVTFKSSHPQLGTGAVTHISVSDALKAALLHNAAHSKPSKSSSYQKRKGKEREQDSDHDPVPLRHAGHRAIPDTSSSLKRKGKERERDNDDESVPLHDGIGRVLPERPSSPNRKSKEREDDNGDEPVISNNAANGVIPVLPSSPKRVVEGRELDNDDETAPPQAAANTTPPVPSSPPERILEEREHHNDDGQVSLPDEANSVLPVPSSPPKQVVEEQALENVDEPVLLHDAANGALPDTSSSPKQTGHGREHDKDDDPVPSHDGVDDVVPDLSSSPKRVGEEHELYNVDELALYSDATNSVLPDPSSTPKRIGEEWEHDKGDELAASDIIVSDTSSPLKRKGKEREHDNDDLAPPHKKGKHSPFEGSSASVSHMDELMDLYWPPTIIDIHDPPDFTNATFAASTRHIHTHILRKQANALRESLSLRPPPIIYDAVYRDREIPSVLSALLRKRPDLAAVLSLPRRPISKENAQHPGTSRDSQQAANTNLSTDTDQGEEQSDLSAGPSQSLGGLDDEYTSSSRPSEVPWLDYDDAMGIDAGLGENVDMNDYFNDLGSASLSMMMSSPSKGLQKDTFMFSFPTRDMFPDRSPMAFRNLDGAHLNRYDPLLSATQGPLGRYATDPILGAHSPGYDDDPDHIRTGLFLEGANNANESHNSQLDDSFASWLLAPESAEFGNLPIDLKEDSPIETTVGSGTIDPSLLGGGTSATESQPHSPSPPPLPSGPTITIPRPRPPVSSVKVQEPALSSPLSSSPPSQVDPRTAFSTDDEQSEEEVKRAKPRKRTKSARSKSTAFSFVQDGGVRRGRRSTIPSRKVRLSKTSPLEAISDDDSSSESSPSVHSRPPSTARRAPSETNEIDDTEERTFCHHCRRATFREKMRCTIIHQDKRMCGKRFCENCILTRYPEVEFDPYHPTFVCPCCTDTCNCSVCSRKRGEEYISMRGTAFAQFRQKKKLPMPKEIVQVADSPERHQSSPKPTTSTAAVPIPTTYWATVYGITGEKVGAAFVGDKNDDRVVMAQLPPVHSSPSKSSTTKRKKARIFAGVPQPWWGIKSYRDVEGGHNPTSSSREERVKGKGKGKVVEKPAVRMYVGDVSRLHAPYMRMSDDLICTPPPSPGFSGSVNSLTPLSALGVPEWPQPAVGECCSWPLPQGVCDDTGENRNAGLQLSTEDVAKAIQAALFAVA